MVLGGDRIRCLDGIDSVTGSTRSSPIQVNKSRLMPVFASFPGPAANLKPSSEDCAEYDWGNTAFSPILDGYEATIQHLNATDEGSGVTPTRSHVPSKPPEHRPPSEPVSISSHGEEQFLSPSQDKSEENNSDNSSQDMAELPEQTTACSLIQIKTSIGHVDHALFVPTLFTSPQTDVPQEQSDAKTNHAAGAESPLLLADPDIGFAFPSASSPRQETDFGLSIRFIQPAVAVYSRQEGPRQGPHWNMCQENNPERVCCVLPLQLCNSSLISYPSPRSFLPISTITRSPRSTPSARIHNLNYEAPTDKTMISHQGLLHLHSYADLFVVTSSRTPRPPPPYQADVTLAPTSTPDPAAVKECQARYQGSAFTTMSTIPPVNAPDNRLSDTGMHTVIKMDLDDIMAELPSMVEEGVQEERKTERWVDPFAGAYCLRGDWSLPRTTPDLVYDDTDTSCPDSRASQDPGPGSPTGVVADRETESGLGVPMICQAQPGPFPQPTLDYLLGDVGIRQCSWLQGIDPANSLLAEVVRGSEALGRAGEERPDAGKFGVIGGQVPFPSPVHASEGQRDWWEMHACVV